MDSTRLHEATHAIQRGTVEDYQDAVKLLLAAVATLAVEVEQIKRAQACPHQSEPEHGEQPPPAEPW